MERAPSELSVAVTPAKSSIWVFGEAENGIGTWHLTGSHWAELNTGKNVLFSASVVTARDIWATGDNGPGLNSAPVGPGQARKPRLLPAHRRLRRSRRLVVAALRG
ncbi:MAG TPA: hypothetical protein VGM14_24540 [Streptosporangiaceae bacterium]